MGNPGRAQRSEIIDDVRTFYFTVGSLTLVYLLYVVRTYLSFESPMALLEALQNKSYVGAFQMVSAAGELTVVVPHAKVFWDSLLITAVLLASPFLLGIAWHYYKGPLAAASERGVGLWEFICHMVLATILGVTPALLLVALVPPIQFPQLSAKISLLASLTIILGVLMLATAVRRGEMFRELGALEVLAFLLLGASLMAGDYRLPSLPGEPHFASIFAVVLLLITMCWYYWRPMKGAMKVAVPFSATVGLAAAHEVLWAAFFMVKYREPPSGSTYYLASLVASALLLKVTASRVSRRSTNAALPMYIYLLAAIAYDAVWLIAYGFVVTMLGLAGSTPYFGSPLANQLEIYSWWVPSLASLFSALALMWAARGGSAAPSA